VELLQVRTGSDGKSLGWLYQIFTDRMPFLLSEYIVTASKYWRTLRIITTKVIKCSNFSITSITVILIQLSITHITPYISTGQQWWSNKDMTFRTDYNSKAKTARRPWPAQHQILIPWHCLGPTCQICLWRGLRLSVLSVTPAHTTNKLHQLTYTWCTESWQKLHNLQKSLCWQPAALTGVWIAITVSMLI